MDTVRDRVGKVFAACGVEFLARVHFWIHLGTWQGGWRVEFLGLVVQPALD